MTSTAPLRRTFDALSGLTDFATNPYRAMDRLYERHGPVSWLGAGAVRFAVVLGPQANEFVLANTDLFSWRRAFASLVPLAGAAALPANDGAAHRRLRRLVQPAFAPRRIAAQADVVRRHVDRVIETWRPGDVVEVYGSFRVAFRDAIVEVLFGPDALARAAGLRDHLQRIHEAIDVNPLVRKVQSLGVPSWRRAVAARRIIRRWVLAECGRRIDDDRDDVLGVLLAGRAGDVEPLTEDEICDQLISLWEAAAETTVATFAWALYCSLSDRTIWDALADRPDHAGRVVQETLRLYPAAAIAARMAATDFEFAGHRFPAGTKLVFSPYHTHRLASVWPEPLRFSPDRWAPPARTPRPHEFLPFGGGPHRCVGATFATAAVRAALDQVVGRTRPWLVSGNAEPAGLIGMRPKHGLTLLIGDVIR